MWEAGLVTCVGSFELLCRLDVACNKDFYFVTFVNLFGMHNWGNCQWEGRFHLVPIVFDYVFLCKDLLLNVLLLLSDLVFSCCHIRVE